MILINLFCAFLITGILYSVYSIFRDGTYGRHKDIFYLTIAYILLSIVIDINFLKVEPYIYTTKILYGSWLFFFPALEALRTGKGFARNMKIGGKSAKIMSIFQIIISILILLFNPLMEAIF